MPNHTAWLCNVSVKVVARLIESALWQLGRIFTANSSKECRNWADRMRSLCMHGWLVSATLRKDKHAYFLLNPHLGHGLISRLPRMGLLRWTATWTPVHFVEKGQSPRLRRKPAMSLMHAWWQNQGRRIWKGGRLASLKTTAENMVESFGRKTQKDLVNWFTLVIYLQTVVLKAWPCILMQVLQLDCQGTWIRLDFLEETCNTWSWPVVQIGFSAMARHHSIPLWECICWSCNLAWCV